VQARTGDLDVAYVSGLELDAARAAHLAIVRKTTNIVDYLQLNEKRPALRSARVRRGIAEAVDRDRIALSVYRGLEESTQTGQTDPAIDSAGRLPRVDAAAARRDLAGVPPLELAIAGQWRSSSAAALQIVAGLQAAGVTATIHSYGSSVFWGPPDAGGILDLGRFDIALTSWSPSLDPDRSYLFGCSAVPPGGGNAGGYCDPAFDAAERRGAATYDPRSRVAAYREAHRLLARDLPIVPLGLEVSAYVVSPRFAGFKPNVLGRDYWNAWEWRVRPSSP
jgi:cationic peptide transport system substrate-binding protein